MLGVPDPLDLGITSTVGRAAGLIVVAIVVMVAVVAVAIILT